MFCVPTCKTERETENKLWTFLNIEKEEEKINSTDFFNLFWQKKIAGIFLALSFFVSIFIREFGTEISSLKPCRCLFQNSLPLCMHKKLAGIPRRAVCLPWRFDWLRMPSLFDLLSPSEPEQSRSFITSFGVRRGYMELYKKCTYFSGVLC